MTPQEFNDKMIAHRRKFASFKESFTKLTERMFNLDTTIPSWEEAYDQQILYTRLYELNHEIEGINKLVGSFRYTKAIAEQLIYQEIDLHYTGRVTVQGALERDITGLLEMEWALLQFKDSLDRKVKMIHSASHMQNMERHRLFNG